jgi:hypothetical protein
MGKSRIWPTSRPNSQKTKSSSFSISLKYTRFVRSIRIDSNIRSRIHNSRDISGNILNSVRKTIKSYHQKYRTKKLKIFCFNEFIRFMGCLLVRLLGSKRWSKIPDFFISNSFLIPLPNHLNFCLRAIHFCKAHIVLDL